MNKIKKQTYAILAFLLATTVFTIFSVAILNASLLKDNRIFANLNDYKAYV